MTIKQIPIQLKKIYLLLLINILFALNELSADIYSSTTKINSQAPSSKITIKDDTTKTLVNPQIFTISFEGKTRKYLVYKPENNSNRNPDGLIVACHSFGGKMENMYQYYGIKSIANTLNMVVLAPQALPEEDQKLQKKLKNTKYKLSAVWGKVLYIDASYKVLGVHIPFVKAYFNSKIDDIAFIHSLIQNVQAKYSVNTKNTFIVGSSMGGFMSYAYATRYGNELSGLINIVGSMGVKLDTASVNVSLPILDFHSTTDGVVFYSGKGYYASVKNVFMKNAIPKLEVLDYWARKNGASRNPVITFIGTNTNKGVSYKKYYYDHPTNEITHFQLTGAPHSYSIKVSDGDPINHSSEIRNFIQRHTK